MNDILISSTTEYVKQKLSNAEGGHDWRHVYRVWKNTQEIAAHEKVDHLVVELAALLHDIADSKFNDGNEEIGPLTALNYLKTTSIDEVRREHIVNIIKHMSYKNSLETKVFSSLEMQVVQDADRLDAIGAIGIARAFNYGGFKNRLIFDPDILPNLQMTKEEYKKSKAPTINHFYEKLLLLKDLMITESGKRLAEKRHNFMIEFLHQFYDEVGVQSWP